MLFCHDCSYSLSWCLMWPLMLCTCRDTIGQLDNSIINGQVCWSGWWGLYLFLLIIRCLLCSVFKTLTSLLSQCKSIGWFGKLGHDVEWHICESFGRLVWALSGPSAFVLFLLPITGLSRARRSRCAQQSPPPSENASAAGLNLPHTCLMANTSSNLS